MPADGPPSYTIFGAVGESAVIAADRLNPSDDGVAIFDELVERELQLLVFS